MHRRFALLALCSTLGACGDRDPASAPDGAPATSDRGSGTAQASSSALAATNGAWFVEEAHARGLDFRWESGFHERYLFPEIVGGGGAFFDADLDGDLDAYLVQAGKVRAGSGPNPPDQLFANDGRGFFRDVTSASGVEERGYGMGAGAGDYDNDGDTDLYVTNWGPNTLLRNDGALRLRDVTAESGAGDPNWGTSSSFFDYDKDGDLDLYCANYVVWSEKSEIECTNVLGGLDYCGPKSYGAPCPDTLLENRGDGTFRDVSVAAGLRRAFGNGLGVVCGDWNGDGWEDVLVANDGTMNQLWMNQADGTFVDGAMRAGCAIDVDGYVKAGMGVSAADFDDDGDEDLLIVNLERESDSFFENEGGRMRSSAPSVGLAVASRSFTRFGCGLVDFDLDGWHDLYVANGRVLRPATALSPHDPFAEPDLLFRGSREGRFEEVEPRGGTVELLVETGRAAIFGDVDGDGAPDVLVVNRDAPAHLLLNRVAGRGHWVGFSARDEHGRDALGATLVLRVGSRTLTRVVRSGYSYCAANDPRVSVGLGEAKRVERVIVRWIGGAEESFGPFECDRQYVLERGEGKEVER